MTGPEAHDPLTGGGTTPSSPSGRPTGEPAVVVVLAGSVVVLVGTFLPWIRSGAVWRDSYELWQSADRLEVLSGAALEVLHVLWFLLPVGAGLQLLAIALRRPGWAVGLGVPLSGVPAVGAVLALRGPLPSGSGVLVTIVGAGVVLAGLVVAGLHRVRARSATGAPGRRG